MKSAPARKRAIVIADLGRGGSQRVVAHLAANWRANCEVTVITLAAPAASELPLPTGVHRIALNCIGQSMNPLSAATRNLRRVWALRNAIRTSGATHVVSFLAATNILTILACRGLGANLTISERNDPARQRLGFAWELLRRGLYRFADTVTANSRRAVESLQIYVPRSKLLYIPNPLPDWHDEPPPAAVRERILLAVGRLHPQKAYDQLLPMFAASCAPALGWRLVILGEGDARAAIERLRDELGLEKCVSLLGYQSDIKAWYDKAAIFVMTSRYEGTANALIEGIARGLPVIVSETSGDGPSYVRELGCGYVIDAGDTGDGATAIDRLVQDPALRSKFGAAGRAGLSDLFAPGAALSLWEQAMKGSRCADQ